MRLIRKRFPRPIAERLARIAWWDWPFDVIIKRPANFQSNDIDGFCDCWDGAPDTTTS